MSLKFWLFTSLIILSCYPKPKLNIIQDEFDDSLTYILDNNILKSSDNTHEVELNIQKSITEKGLIYLMTIECIGSTEIGLNDSAVITFKIDNEKIELNPISVETKTNIDPDLILEIGNFITDFNFIKKVAYGNKVSIKINGNRKIIYSHLNLDNKINLQDFIETFVPLEEQIKSN